MTRYLISFDDGTMIIPEEEMPAVAEAAHEVVYEDTDDGGWIFGGGLLSQRASIVATDGTVTQLDTSPDRSTTYTESDGTVTTTGSIAHPTWGTAAPILSPLVETRPAFLRTSRSLNWRKASSFSRQSRMVRGLLRSACSSA